MFEDRLPEKKYGTLTQQDVAELSRDLNREIERRGSDNGQR